MSTFVQWALLAQVQVGGGQVQGGWEYVWMGYGLTWASITLYALSLWLRRPQALEDQGGQAR